MTDNARPSIESAAGNVADALKGILGEASPSTVFSEPVTVGDHVVITASAWERGGGFGFGAGSGDSPQGTGSGSGGGGGGGSVGRPVAVIRIGPSGMEVRPVLDFTKILVTVLLSALGVWRVLRR